ncbi:MAG: hypothetical protein IJW81_12410, partial [Clostridia bacterium]|nr:hypothetical protein [Clostridia bacterium]
MNNRILRRIGSLFLLTVFTFPSCGNGEAEIPDVPPVQYEPTNEKGEETGMQPIIIHQNHTHEFAEGTYAEAFNRFTMTYT